VGQGNEQRALEVSGSQRNVKVLGGISTGKSERKEGRDKGPGSLTQQI